MSKLNIGESNMSLSKELDALILRYGFVAVSDFFKSKGEQKIVLDGDTIIKGVSLTKPITGDIIAIHNEALKLVTKLTYKDAEINIDQLKKSVKCDSTVEFPYCSMQDVLVVEITIKGLVKNNPKAELLFHFSEPLSKNTVIGDFYDNAIHYAKSVVDELKSGN